MRGVDCRQYDVTIQTPQGTQTQPYTVSESLAFILLSPQRQLNGADLLRAHAIAQKILESEGTTVLLEEAEWNQVRDAINTVKGLGQNDVEMVRRVLEAPTVAVGPVAVPSRDVDPAPV